MRALYLGLSKASARRYRAHFCPLIRVIPFSLSSPQFRTERRFQASHVILTSPTSAAIFMARMKSWDLHYLCIGKETAQRVLRILPKAVLSVAELEQGEGLIPLLTQLPQKSRILYPHSELARPVITDFLLMERRYFFSYAHYTIRPCKLPLKAFKNYRHIILTSSSCVQAYHKHFPILPRCTHWCKGTITQHTFEQCYPGSFPKLLKHYDEAFSG